MVDSVPERDVWTEQMSAFDRVYSVAISVSGPTSVVDVAAEADVAETTARTHLERLVEMTVLLKCDEKIPTTYEPDPLYTRIQTLRDLLADHDYDNLLNLQANLEDRVDAWRTEYDVNSPEGLREQIVESTNSTTKCEMRQAANDWELVRYRLTIIEDAIENYAIYTCNSDTSGEN